MGETKQVKTSMDHLSTGIIMMNGYLTLFASGFAVHINAHCIQINFSVIYFLFFCKCERTQDLQISEVYSEPCQRSKTELFA